MKLLSAILTLLCIVIAGCASPQARQLKVYAAQQKELARAGTIKWSDYYKDLYGRTAALRGADRRADVMAMLNFLIAASLEYEKGAITKDAFEGIQRDAQVAMQRKSEEDRQAATQGLQNDLSNALKGYAEATKNPPQIRRRPDPCFQDQYGQTICKSQ